VAASSTASVRSYSFTDATPIKGTNCYRLRMVEKDGKVSYSEIRLLNFGTIINTALFPNPTIDKATITGVEAGMTIRLLDAAGKVLLIHLATGTTESIPVSSLSKGLYKVQVYGTNGNLLNTTQLVKE
ncbi:MAG: T9SS type A sorting domain-containing protein, partial [Sphingobacteriaceae bacterium]